MTTQSRLIMVKGRTITSWRFVAGVFVHCLVPAYLVVLPLTYLFSAKVDQSSGAIVRQVLTLSGQFLAGYGALAVIATTTAVAVAPMMHWHRTRRIARDPRLAERLSHERLADAVSKGRQIFNQPLRLLLETIRRRGWEHDDPRFQALSADVVEVVRTSAVAIASASPQRRADLYAMTEESLGHIDAALAALEQERSRLDEGDAKVIARYVRLRHVQADSAGGPL